MEKQAKMVLGPKPTKACGAPPCRRCRHTQTACVFKPRANASAIHELVDEAQNELLITRTSTAPDQQAILDRLDRIEAALGITQDASETGSVSQDMSIDDEVDSVPLQGVWNAVAHLRSITRPVPDEKVWSRPTIKKLWSSFLNNLPLLHFLSDRDAFVSPTPLLLASVLYISALHHRSSELASFDAGYFAATCSAINELLTPSFRPGLPPRRESHTTDDSADSLPPKRRAFNDILGLIMASLSSEAYIDATGSWIAMAYRLWLDHCPSQIDATTPEWRGLFSGLQVIDIEHASMHMSYPMLPRQPPTPGIQRVDNHQGNAYQSLSDMMHYGLSHFVGRGLPTIWSSINADVPDSPVIQTSFTEQDSEVIRLWARKIDDWLVKYNGASQPSPSDRQGIVILLQYHLHKLYVLSIYHPARGFDLSSANITPVERHELLVSARAVLRLRQDDASIWSNWDLIMITWAAILLLRGVEDGMTHQDDLHLIQAHLRSLERSHQSSESVHTVLSQRLESSMQAMHTPPDTTSALAFPVANADDSWAIFDQEIMSLANPPWLFQDSAFPHTQKSPTHQVQPVQTGLQSVAYGSGLMPTPAQQFAASAQWGTPPEAMQDALPSTLNRIFGNEPHQSHNNGLM
ncbi:hypothetical protein N7509_003722 [Penicillium cosmopolitanum]|uniref:Transcription factor domain-containing protein n=1 Tax=Penicillium cosmopolitanum TaxID=1131564 RepID=A0A9W9W5W1_9EURO|nr:uncharacterized protein N7509_003722 [Penicillium cosmopolitanum]KAJ5403851.1 hypothetical protein N7509_003722 [Penicillium cosmopolitanum]